MFPVVIDAVLGLMATATFAELEFDPEEPAETPQPARPRVPTSKETRLPTIQEHGFLVRGFVLFEASMRCRAVIHPAIRT